MLIGVLLVLVITLVIRLGFALGVFVPNDAAPPREGRDEP